LNRTNIIVFLELLYSRIELGVHHWYLFALSVYKVVYE